MCNANMKLSLDNHELKKQLEEYKYKNGGKTND